MMPKPGNEVVFLDQYKAKGKSNASRGWNGMTDEQRTKLAVALTVAIVLATLCTFWLNPFLPQ